MASSKSQYGPGTIFVNYCLSLALLWYLWRSYRQYGLPSDFLEKLFFLVLFVIGLGWLLVTVYFTVERLKYGDVRLEMPGRVVPGGKFAAVLRVPRRLAGTRSLAAKLQCKDLYEKRSSTGEGKVLAEDVVWSVEADFPVVARGRGSECRIEFDVPESALTTSTSASSLGFKSPGIYWELEVHAEVSGVDLKRSFAIRVVSGPVAGVARAAPASQRGKM